MDKNDDTTYENLWNEVKGALRWKFIAVFILKRKKLST